MFPNSSHTPRNLHGRRRYCQDLAEFDHAMWSAAQSQIVRDDIEEIFSFRTDCMERLATASEASLQTLASGVCSSFRIAALKEEHLKQALQRPYSSVAVITTMSDGLGYSTLDPTPLDINQRIRSNLLSRMFDVSVNISHAHSIESSAIKTGLPRKICKILQDCTLAQVRRAAWSLSEDVRFEARFPERIMDLLSRQDLSKIAQKKLNFAFSDGLFDTSSTLR